MLQKFVGRVLSLNSIMNMQKMYLGSTIARETITEKKTN